MTDDIRDCLRCTPVDLAKILPRLSERAARRGEAIYAAGDVPRDLFLVRAGCIRVSVGGVASEVRRGFLGEETALGIPTRQAAATAMEDSTLLVIPGDVVARLCTERPELKADLSASFLERITGVAAPKEAAKAKATAPRSGAWTFAAWMFTILVPALVFLARPLLDLDFNAVLFLTIFAAAIMMWLFNIVNEFIPGLFAVGMLLVLDVAPPSVVLSGFSSDEFFMILSVSALGAVIESSGLAYRAILLVLKRTPPSSFWCSIVTALSGILVTPVLPSANGRVNLGIPVYRDMIETLGYQRGQKAATGLATAMFAGLTLFSGVFLTSKTIHFVVYGMLPQQVAHQFGWVYWTVSAAAYGFILLVLYAIGAAFFFRSAEAPRIPRPQIERQLDALGPMGYRELAALVGVAVMVFGFTTTGLHQIDPPWMALALLFILLALNVVDKKEFHHRINWPFLMYLGALSGLSKCMAYIGLDQWFGSHLGFVIHAMRADFPLFVFLLFVAITVFRFFIPNNATVVIFASLLLPMAGLAGIHPWIVGFVILALSDGWILPYQCTYYLEFRELNASAPWYNERSFLWFNALCNLFRVGAVFGSLVYWKWLGLL